MVRRYDEAVQVRVTDTGDGVSGPGAFLWRGRLYVVRSVLAHWRERHAWWRGAVEDPGGQDATAQQEAAGLRLEQRVWRVEASAGRAFGTGVYDLTVDVTGDGTSGLAADVSSGVTTGVTTEDLSGDWRLVRVAD